MKRTVAVMLGLCASVLLMLACSDEETADTGSLITALELNGATLAPPFATGTTNYTAAVANTVESVTLIPQFVEGTSAAVTVGGTPLTASGDTWVVPLAVGANSVVLTATHNDRTEVCTIVITRAAPPGNDPSLSAITFDATTSGFSFDPATTNYTFSIGSSTIKVTPTATDPAATIRIAVGTVTNDIESGTASETITLNYSGGTMNVKPGAPPPAASVHLYVTAENGVDNRHYLLNLTQY
jgi:hypothetical protein